MPPRSVSNSGSATPPRPNRRAASPRSPSPVRSERAPPPENNQEPKIVIFKLAEEVRIVRYRQPKTSYDPISNPVGVLIEFSSSLLQKEGSWPLWTFAQWNRLRKVPSKTFFT